MLNQSAYFWCYKNTKIVKFNMHIYCIFPISIMSMNMTSWLEWNLENNQSLLLSTTIPETAFVCVYQTEM